jgi:hypothetical protein
MESYLSSAKLLVSLVPLIFFVLTGAAQAQPDDKELVAKGQYIFS